MKEKIRVSSVSRSTFLLARIQIGATIIRMTDSCYLLNVRFEGLVRQFTRVSYPGRKDQFVFGLFSNEEVKVADVYCSPNTIVASQLSAMFGKDSRVSIMCSKTPEGNLKGLEVQRICSHPCHKESNKCMSS